jgi:hypothetical protein
VRGAVPEAEELVERVEALEVKLSSQKELLGELAEALRKGLRCDERVEWKADCPFHRLLARAEEALKG